MKVFREEAAEEGKKEDRNRKITSSFLPTKENPYIEEFKI